MENILKQLKENVEVYERLNGRGPDYIIMGWDLAYEDPADEGCLQVYLKQGICL